MNKITWRLNCLLATALVVLGLGGYISVCHAQAIINDLTAPTSGGLSSGPYESQDFQASGGGITSVTLDLNFSAAAVAAGLPLDVYVWNSSGSGPTYPLPYYGLLGTITPTVAGAYDYSVNILHNFGLVGGQDYSIQIDTALTAGTVAWEYTSAANAAAANTGNLGSFLSGYTSPDTATWTATGSSVVFQVEVVPEPSTTAFLGFGGMALIFVQRLRGKKS